MPLPELIEVVPLDKPFRAEITVPGSKSITNRALVLAALSEGETILQGALWSEDTQVMVECLQELGFMVNHAAESDEPCNRTITVYGKGGEVSRGGIEGQPLQLFVGNAGTAARFLAAFLCLGKGVYRLHGTPRMHARPQAALFHALRELGYQIDSSNDRLPAVIHGAGPREGNCRVSIAESSQFASALLLCRQVGRWQVTVEGENAEESPYVAMTSKLVKVFPADGGTFQIEPDASGGSYFLAAGIEKFGEPVFDKTQGVEVVPAVSQLTIRNWPRSDWQIDAKFQDWMARFAFDSVCAGIYSPEFMARRYGPDWRGNFEVMEKEGFERIVTSRRDDLGDSIMMGVVLAPFAVLPARFIELGRLRVQECERVMALRTELTKCGAKVIEEGDTLTVYPSELHGAVIETYNDHRVAMCFSVLGLKVPGMKIKNPACVKKTFPNFFQKLAAPAPHGLGAKILDGMTGRLLNGDELLAA